MRPLPHIPRLAVRKAVQPTRILLACPRVSPEWELGAVQALIKPQLKAAILHRSGVQALPPNVRERVEAVVDSVGARIGYRPAVHWPLEGDYVFAVEVSPAELPDAKGLALALSRATAGAWLVLGRLFVRDGRFFRRERRFKLNLVVATNVHLSRPVRSALHGVL